MAGLGSRGGCDAHWWPCNSCSGSKSSGPSPPLLFYHAFDVIIWKGRRLPEGLKSEPAVGPVSDLSLHYFGTAKPTSPSPLIKLSFGGPRLWTPWPQSYLFQGLLCPFWVLREHPSGCARCAPHRCYRIASLGQYGIAVPH